MLIIDTTTPIPDGRLKIPSYHRGHLSLKSGTEVTTCLLPRVGDTPFPLMSEMIVSPIAFDSWRYLARVSAIFHDHPGVVRKIAQTLRESHVDIMYEESASIENGRYHRVEMLIDPQQQYARFKEQPNNDRVVLGSLERRLKAVCFDELIFDGSRARLKVRLMEGLRNAWTQFRALSSDILHHVERAPVDDGILIIPVEILRAVQQKPPSRAVLISDTKDRLLRVLFPHDDMDFTYLRVAHNDSIGALALITEKLANAFNAILTLSRLKTQGERNDVELLLFSAEYPTSSDDMIRRAIAESLLCEDVLHHLRIEVSYPSRAGAIGPDPHTPRIDDSISWQRVADLVPSEPELTGKSTIAILKARIENYRKGVNESCDLATAESFRVRLDAAKKLLAREGVERLPAPTIFVSYDFSHSELFDLVKSELTKRDCEVSDGQNAFEGEQFREVIRQRMARSNGLIAIWKARDDGTFSPWLLWELGVAQAMKLPYCLFVHTNVRESPHVRINPEKHHISFRNLDFGATLTERLPQFLRQVSDSEREQILRRQPSGFDEELWDLS